MPADDTQYSRIISGLDDGHKRGMDTGDLCYFDSSVELHESDGVEFELRLCPSLAQKKIASVDSSKKEASDMNPFLPPYKPGLYIGDVEEDGEHFVVLLNKYCVVPQHFLLVTRDFKVQGTPLTPEELTASYKLLAAAKRQGKSFFMFFNHGVASGSSQRHKHVQFIPIESASPDRSPDGPPIERLAKRARLEADWKPFTITPLKYAHNVIRLPPYDASRSSEEVSDMLAQTYIKLLDLTMKTFTLQPDSPLGKGEKPAYNVLLTLEHMHMIPRSKPEFEHLPLLDEHARLPVNALGFAGMLMVKSETERQALINAGPMNVLSEVGLPEVHGESCSKVESSLMDDDV